MAHTPICPAEFAIGTGGNAAERRYAVRYASESRLKRFQLAVQGDAASAPTYVRGNLAVSRSSRSPRRLLEERGRLRPARMENGEWEMLADLFTVNGVAGSLCRRKAD